MTVTHDGIEYPLHDLLGPLTPEQIDRVWEDAEDYQAVWNRVCTLFPHRLAECLAHARACQEERAGRKPVGAETDPLLRILNERDHSLPSADEQGWR